MHKILRFIPLLMLTACCSTNPGTQPNSPSDDSSPIATQAPDNAEVPSPSPTPSTPARPESCPTDKPASDILPGMTSSDLSPDSWPGTRDTVMSQAGIEQFNARFYARINDLEHPVDRTELEQNMRKRLDSFREKIEKNEIMFEDGTRPDPADYERAFDEFQRQYDESNLHQYRLLEDATILCAPHDRPYIKTVDGEVRFSRNNCSLGRAQDRIEVLFTHQNGMRFVRTRDMWGWLSPNAKLSPEIPKSGDSRWFTEKSMQLAGMTIPKGAFLEGTKSDVFVATPDGISKLPARDIDGLIDTHRPLTRKDWFKTLFLFVGDPYGWGGHDGWRDCSRLILDTARSFNIKLPRNSKEQAVKTSYYLKVAGMTPEDKLKAIENAAQTGIVILYFPGHIMAWMGRNAQNKPTILHSFSEYYEACADKGNLPDDDAKTLVHVDRVVLSDLSLGEGTSRGSYLDRVTIVAVLTEMSRKPDNAQNQPWNVTREWTPAEETLFSAFMERLFDYPDEPDKTWTNLGDVLRDKDHNIFFNSLGQNEESNLKLRPDCADLPYMLRSYFAWKRGLPMAVRKCGRGTKDSAPKCGRPTFVQNTSFSGNEAKRYNSYALHVGGYEVHSGNARTALTDSNTDFYPVELTRSSLRPGLTYADPHGHLLMIAHYTPDTPEVPGSLLSVDAQPDGTITRKRFWKGNFLFDPEMKNVGAGFKAFRPIVDNHQLTNEELNDQSGFVPYSDEQNVVEKEVFYDRVEAAIHPKPLDIPAAVAELTDALHESAERRVLNVQNGDDYVRNNGVSSMIMPLGYAVFETSGPWEDFATPSRDMRMLIAIDAVRDFPDQIRRNAARYGLNDDDAIQKAVAEAQSAMDEVLAKYTITYMNSAGNPVTITMKTIVERVENLEMAYHPADCNEVRWGTPENDPEYATCSRRASASEQAKLEKMRVWFHKRARPGR
ncbi:MAG: C40 family peptidase [Proteobacteria bacterium]|nr:C40 family peptidase [Pseudomonadota bacterium]